MTKRPDIKNDEVERLYYAGHWTQQEIADYYGVGRTTIYRRLHPDKAKEWIDNNIEVIKEYQRTDKYKTWLKVYTKEWRESEEGKAYMKSYQESEKGKDVKKKSSRKYAKTDKCKEAHKRYSRTDKFKETQSRFRKTDKGKEMKMRQHSKRRELGFVCLNAWFLDGVWHHIDEEHVICIPEELHKSVKHNVHTGQGMEEINTIAFRYINEETFDKLIAGEI